MDRLTNANIIKSISYDQDEILNWIIKLYCPNGFELDPTYSKGYFYKNIQQPKYKFDLKPQTEDTIQADCRKLLLENNSISTIMFDPPFLAGIPADNKEPTGIIKKRFGYFKNIQHDLWDFYYDSLGEFYRILKPNGILVFKCQDTVDGGKQCLSHIEIVNMANEIGFYPKDLFILLAKTRIIGSNSNIQQHARKYHSYFLIFKKQESKVNYGLTRAVEINPKDEIIIIEKNDKN